MSILVEIEQAAYQLPLAEQQQLLRNLSRRIGASRRVVDPAKRAQWMEELRNLRDSIGTGSPTLSSERILEELREERI